MNLTTNDSFQYHKKKKIGGVDYNQQLHISTNRYGDIYVKFKELTKIIIN
jgi:hypothetical protein